MKIFTFLITTIATILGPSWSGVTSPAIMAQALHRIWLVWPEAEFTVEEDPDGSVTIRANRPYQHIFGESGILFDVSVQDVETVWYVFRKTIAQQQGMEFNQVEDNGWFIIQISSK